METTVIPINNSTNTTFTSIAIDLMEKAYLLANSTKIGQKALKTVWEIILHIIAAIIYTHIFGKH